jgi:HlyD family type I secretion membrane fusion protein
MQPSSATAAPLRTEEVQDILAAMPSRAIRLGNTFILAIIVGLLGLAWLIHYPDIVAGQAQLTTMHEPAYVYARASGNIRQLHVRDGEQVHEGQLLAEVTSTLKKQQAEALQQRLVAVNAFLAGQADALTPEPAGASFGDLQASYNALNENLNNLRQLYAPYYAAAAQRLRANAARYTQSIAIYQTKLAVTQRELANAQVRYQANQRLFEGRTIPRLELLEKESAYNQKLNEVADVRQTIVQTTQLLANEQKQLADLDFSRNENIRKLRSSSLLQAKALEAALQNWKQLNSIIAPAAGQVVFLEKFSAGFYTKTDKPLLAIVPANEQLIAKVKVAATRYGKIEAGQRVRLTLDNYPFQEYGFLFGQVRQKSYIPVEKKYELIVALPQQLITSYGRRVAYRPNMPASAEVIVEEQRLLEKMLYSVRQLLRRRA